MTAIELIIECQSRGIELTPVPGDRIHVKASSPVPEPIRAELALRKGELLTPDLRAYVEALDAWTSSGLTDLPPAPPFPECPERPLAWSAWWSAVEAHRRRKGRS